MPVGTVHSQHRYIVMNIVPQKKGLPVKLKGLGACFDKYNGTAGMTTGKLGASGTTEMIELSDTNSAAAPGIFVTPDQYDLVS